MLKTPTDFFFPLKKRLFSRNSCSMDESGTSHNVRQINTVSRRLLNLYVFTHFDYTDLTPFL